MAEMRKGKMGMPIAVVTAVFVLCLIQAAEWYGPKDFGPRATYTGQHDEAAPIQQVSILSEDRVKVSDQPASTCGLAGEETSELRNYYKEDDVIVVTDGDGNELRAYLGSPSGETVYDTLTDLSDGTVLCRGHNRTDWSATEVVNDVDVTADYYLTPAEYWLDPNSSNADKGAWVWTEESDDEDGAGDVTHTLALLPDGSCTTVATTTVLLDNSWKVDENATAKTTRKTTAAWSVDPDDAHRLVLTSKDGFVAHFTLHTVEPDCRCDDYLVDDDGNRWQRVYEVDPLYTPKTYDLEVTYHDASLGWDETQRHVDENVLVETQNGWYAAHNSTKIGKLIAGLHVGDIVNIDGMTVQIEGCVINQNRESIVPVIRRCGWDKVYLQTCMYNDDWNRSYVWYGTPNKIAFEAREVR